VVMVTTPWQISIKLVFSLSLSLSAVPFTALYISIPPGKNKKKINLRKENYIPAPAQDPKSSLNVVDDKLSEASEALYQILLSTLYYLLWAYPEKVYLGAWPHRDKWALV